MIVRRFFAAALLPCALLLCALGSTLSALDPAPATITPDNGKSIEGAVKDESIDGVVYLLNVGGAGPAVEAKLAAGKYRIEYRDVRELEYLRAQKLEESGKLADAAAGYLEAVTKTKFQFVKETAQVAAGRLYLAAKQFDPAIKVLTEFASSNPRSLKLPDALDLLGRAQQAKGDLDGALKTFDALSALTVWGPAATALGQIGKAAVLTEQKKPADAAGVLAVVFAKLPSEDEAFAKAGLALIAAQLAAGNTDAAMETVRRVAYASPLPAYQARAHLAWAQLFSDKADLASLTTAFDHACLATALRGADLSTRTEALRVARAVNTKLQADKSLTDAIKLEYKNYVQRL